MLTIPQGIYREMVAAARAEAPLEACGLLAGRENQVESLFPMTNGDASAEHFSLIPEEQFAAAREIRARGQQLLAVWHSHPATPSRPSPEDLRLAVAPDMLHLILSLAGEEPKLRGFRIADGRATPVELEIQAEETDYE